MNTQLGVAKCLDSSLWRISTIIVHPFLFSFATDMDKEGHLSHQPKKGCLLFRLFFFYILFYFYLFTFLSEVSDKMEVIETEV